MFLNALLVRIQNFTLVVIAFFALNPTAFAQVPVNTDPAIQDPPGGGVVDFTPEGRPFVPNLTQSPGAESNQNVQTDTLSGGAGNASLAGGANSDQVSSKTAWYDLLGHLSDWLEEKIYTVLVGIGGIITWVGGNMLDWAIDKLVLKFGKLLNEELGFAVNSIWETVRDLINITFIFVLIWIGLKTILEADDSSLKKQLGYLILAALLINFSLFISKAIVDFSNIAAVQISQAFEIHATGADGQQYYINTGPFGGLYPYPQNVDTSGSRFEIAGAFMQATRLTSYASQIVVSENSFAFVVVYGLLVMFMMIIAGFVFAAGAILLIIRFVTLVLAMMFSPMMFLGWIYPGLQKLAKPWWSIFLKNAFVAPAYLFMLYIALAIVRPSEQGGFGFVNGAIAEAVSSGSSMSFGIFLHFALVIGFLMAAVKVAEMMGTYGSGAVVKVGSMGSNWIRQLGSNVGNAAYRNSFGRYYQSSSDRLNRAREKKAAGQKLGMGDRWSLGVARVSGAGSLRTAAEYYKTGANKTPFGKGVGRTDQIAEQKKLKSTGARKAEVDRLITEITEGSKTGNNARIEQAFSDMSNAQLLDIAKSKTGFELIKNNAQFLSANQFKAIADSEDIDDKQTAQIAATRTNAIKTKITNPADIKKLSKEDLDTLGVDYLSQPDIAINLTEEKIKNLNLIESYKQRIRDARKNGLLNIIKTKKALGGVSFKSLTKLKPADIADLPDEAFQPDLHTGTEKDNVETFITSLQPAQLMEIERKKGADVTKAIRSYGVKTTAGNIRKWLTSDPRGQYFGR